jgi:hypothetical protein
MTADYAVKINRSDGVLEVTAPEKEWVDAKIEQLTPVISEAPAPRAHAGATQKPRAARKRTRDAATEDGRAGSEAPTRRRGNGGRPKINEDLRAQLTSDVRGRLKEYIDARRAKFDGGLSAQAAIIAGFLQDDLGYPGIDHDDLYTVYTDMGERIPGNLRSQLGNARQRARYFGAISGGKYILSNAGENFARFDSVGSTTDDPDDA